MNRPEQGSNIIFFGWGDADVFDWVSICTLKEVFECSLSGVYQRYVALDQKSRNRNKNGLQKGKLLKKGLKKEKKKILKKGKCYSKKCSKTKFMPIRTQKSDVTPKICSKK